MPRYEERKMRMITRATHNTRLSERMIEFGITLWEPVNLSLEEEKEITHYLIQIIKEDHLDVYQYAICKNHVHLILKCPTRTRNNIIRKLKWKTTQLYKEHHHIKTPYHLWTQKYDTREIDHEKYFYSAMEYVKNNRLKHGLEDDADLKILCEKIITKFPTTFPTLA